MLQTVLVTNDSAGEYTPNQWCDSFFGYRTLTTIGSEKHVQRAVTNQSEDNVFTANQVQNQNHSLFDWRGSFRACHQLHVLVSSFGSVAIFSAAVIGSLRTLL